MVQINIDIFTEREALDILVTCDVRAESQGDQRGEERKRERPRCRTLS